MFSCSTLPRRADRRLVVPPLGAAPGRGFSLLEVLLALAVLGLVMGLTLVGLSGVARASRLPEGLRRWEASLRFAQADAASQGRRIRLSIPLSPNVGQPGAIEPSQRVSVLWEDRPLEEPGVFTEYTRCDWASAIPGELVQISRVQPMGQSVYRDSFGLSPAGFNRAGSVDPSTAELTFQPDGSSDSALLELIDPARAASQPESARRAVIELNGVTGRVRGQLLSSDAADERFDERSEDD
jgi:prepilin-type N-terminal cleavage/methylation domain-containing protein